MRSPKPLRLGFALLLAVLAAGAQGAGMSPDASSAPAAPPGGCEPGPDLDLGVRLLDLSRDGAQARAHVRLTLVSRRALTGVTLAGRPVGPEEAEQPEHLAVPALESVLPPRVVRQVTLAVDLEPGREHHLLFTAEGLDGAGARHATSAALRIDLDPARAPRLLDGLVEYRARVQP